ncbi:hypothetical protein Tco_0967186 [Tanacetum coccineum]
MRYGLSEKTEVGGLRRSHEKRVRAPGIYVGGMIRGLMLRVYRAKKVGKDEKRLKEEESCWTMKFSEKIDISFALTIDVQVILSRQRRWYTGCLKGGAGFSGGKRLAISMVEEAWLSEKKEDIITNGGQESKYYVDDKSEIITIRVCFGFIKQLKETLNSSFNSMIIIYVLSCSTSFYDLETHDDEDLLQIDDDAMEEIDSVARKRIVPIEDSNLKSFGRQKTATRLDAGLVDTWKDGLEFLLAAKKLRADNAPVALL